MPKHFGLNLLQQNIFSNFSLPSVPDGYMVLEPLGPQVGFRAPLSQSQLIQQLAQQH